MGGNGSDSLNGAVVKVVTTKPRVCKGSAGLYTQVPGAMTSVSNLASATGGIKPGNLAERDTK